MRTLELRLLEREEEAVLPAALEIRVETTVPRQFTVSRVRVD